MARISRLNVVKRASEGAVMIVRDRTQTPDDEGVYPPMRAADSTPATLTLLGADSPQARKLGYHKQAAAQNRLYANAFGGKKKGSTVTPDDIAQQAHDDLDDLVALTTGWHGFEDDEDVALPCTPEYVRALYEASPETREDALTFVNTRGNFTPRSSTPSVASSSTSSVSVASTTA